jgi:DNA-binding MarR family transcriptional regulator
MYTSAQLVKITRQWMDAVMHRSMRDWSHFVKATDLSMPQFSILMQLHYQGECGMSDVSEHMDITAAAASQLVEKLVNSKLIERAEDPTDRRAKQIKLSPKGKEMIVKGIEERYRWVEEMVDGINVEDRQKVGDALTVLTEIAKSIRDVGQKHRA